MVMMHSEKKKRLGRLRLGRVAMGGIEQGCRLYLFNAHIPLPVPAHDGIHTWPRSGRAAWPSVGMTTMASGNVLHE